MWAVYDVCMNDHAKGSTMHKPTCAAVKDRRELTQALMDAVMYKDTADGSEEKLNEVFAYISGVVPETEDI